MAFVAQIAKSVNTIRQEVRLVLARFVVLAAINEFGSSLLSRRSRNVDRSLRDRNSGHGVTRLQFAQPTNKRWLSGVATGGAPVEAGR